MSEQIHHRSLPKWMESLENEDFSFIRNFVISSGSLKELAQIYKVTYPTVRLRLDRLIQRIQINEKETEEPYIALIKKMAIDEKMDIETTKNTNP